MASEENRISRAVALITQAAEALRGDTAASLVTQTTSVAETSTSAPPRAALPTLNSTPESSSGGFVFRRPNVLNEMRELCSPYNRLGTARPRPRSSTAGPSPRSGAQNRKFFCLGGPEDCSTPKSSYKTMLLEQQLGAKDIVVGSNSSADQLRRLIVDNYPKLTNCEFELLRADDGGPSRPLRRIDLGNPVPAFAVVRSALGSNGMKIIYVRPLTPIFVVGDGEDMDSATDTSPADRSALEEQMDVDDESSSSTTSESFEEASSSAFATRVAAVTSDSAMRVETETDDFQTYEDFQRSLYLENPEVQPITVTRSNFIEQVVGMYLKDSGLDLKKKPKVFFIGESGVDLGGLTKEFFSQALGSVLNEKFSGSIIFEGELDHKLPSTDAVLLRCGVFRAVGKLMAHAYMHTGVAAYGISRAVIEYFVKDVDSQSVLTMDKHDIPSDYEKEFICLIEKWNEVPCDNLSDAERSIIKNFAIGRNYEKDVTFANKCDFWELVNEDTPMEVMNLMRKWKVQSQVSSLTQEEFHSLKEFANSVGFHRPVSLENKFLLKEVILYGIVIDSRKSQLDELKRGFLETGVASFLRNRPYLWDAAFPNSQQLEYSDQAVLGKFEYFGEESHVIRITRLMEEFLQRLMESGRVGTFVQCLTASPILPSCKVGIYVGDYEFSIMTCSLKVEIPEVMGNENIIQSFELAMRFGGFGRA